MNADDDDKMEKEIHAHMNMFFALPVLISFLSCLLVDSLQCSYVHGTKKKG